MTAILLHPQSIQGLFEEIHPTCFVERRYEHHASDQNEVYPTSTKFNIIKIWVSLKPHKKLIKLVNNNCRSVFILAWILFVRVIIIIIAGNFQGVQFSQFWWMITYEISSIEQCIIVHECTHPCKLSQQNGKDPRKFPATCKWLYSQK